MDGKIKPTPASYKVLFLEDEPLIGRIVSRSLEPEGFQVDVVSNGLIAQEKLAAGVKYDLFILDIRMPVVSGSQFYQYLEKTSPHLTGKVIFATGDSLNGSTREFLARVKRPFLTKPYTPEQMKDLVMQTIRQNASAPA
jgi:CheY-like chemotaxis protein